MSELLMQVSDPHFGTERPEVMEALVRLAEAQRPDVLVVSGDITQRARAGQFRAARRFFDRLQVPAVVAIPGNHDIPLFNVFARAFAPYANHRRVFGENLEPVYESPAFLVVTVNTTRRHRHEDGEISAAQIERTSRRFEHARAGQLRIAVTHQPVAVTQAKDFKNVLKNNEAAVRAWSAAGVDLVLGGHIHLPFTVPLHGRFDGLAKRMWAVQAGTALSHRIRHGANNSVNLIRSGALVDGVRHARVERWDYDDTTKQFSLVNADELAVSGPPPQ